MKVSRRFLMYEMWNKQQQRCVECGEHIDARELDEVLMLEAGLVCVECYESANTPVGGCCSDDAHSDAELTCSE